MLNSELPVYAGSSYHVIFIGKAYSFRILGSTLSFSQNPVITDIFPVKITSEFQKGVHLNSETITYKIWIQKLPTWILNGLQLLRAPAIAKLKSYTPIFVTFRGQHLNWQSIFVQAKCVEDSYMSWLHSGKRLRHLTDNLFLYKRSSDCTIFSEKKLVLCLWRQCTCS